MIITRTPFRISFFGGGTDYPAWYREYGGAVLSTTFNKYCYITARYLPPYFDCNYRIRYRHHEETKTIEEIQHPSARECIKFTNIGKGLEIQHNADVPGMSGLGSSSAFTVGLLHALYALEQRDITKYNLARDAITVEQNGIRENVGSQDQTAVAYGGFNIITFGGDEEISVKPLRIEQKRKQDLENHLMLFFIGYPRVASEIVQEQIANIPQRTAELHAMRVLVDDAVSVLKCVEMPLKDFGTLLHEAWLLKRSLSSKITNTAVDNIYNTARQAGAVGGKLLGAGGGGFMLFFVPPEYQNRVQSALHGLLNVPFRFESLGSTVIYNMPYSEV